MYAKNQICIRKEVVMTHQERLELIDDYIQNRMGEEKKQEFCLLLDSDETLRAEMETQLEIMLAIKAKGIKQDLENYEHHKYQKRLRIKAWWSIPSAAAVAACFALFITISGIRKSNFCIEYGTEYICEYTMTDVRDGNVVSALLGDVVMLMKEGEYEEAFSHLDSVDNVLSKVQYEDTEEGAYLQRRTYEQHLESLWFRAIILMQQGEWREARTLLKTISSANDIHSVEANEILNHL